MLDSIETKIIIYIPKVFEPITLEHLDAHDYLTSLPPSLMFDRLFKSILADKPRASKVKIRVLSKQANLIREFVNSWEICKVINSLSKKVHSNHINYVSIKHI